MEAFMHSLPTCRIIRAKDSNNTKRPLNPGSIARHTLYFSFLTLSKASCLLSSRDNKYPWYITATFKASLLPPQAFLEH